MQWSYATPSSPCATSKRLRAAADEGRVPIADLTGPA